jgi:hypothetical protein
VVLTQGVNKNGAAGGEGGKGQVLGRGIMKRRIWTLESAEVGEKERVPRMGRYSQKRRAVVR